MWNKKRFTALLFFISIILALLFSNSFLFTLSLKETFLDFSKLPLKIISLAFVPYKAILHCHNCLRENVLLRKENQDLKVENLLLNDAEEENKGLRKLVSFRQKSDAYYIAAKIIAGEGSNFKRSAVIDKGRKSGIRLGNLVITPDGLVGRVIELGIFASRVVLINDPDFSISAKVQRSGVIGLLSGSLEGNCILKYLEIDDDIKVGDEVVTCEKDLSLPSGIPIGKVTSILKEHSGLTIFAVTKPEIRLNAVEEVLIIPNEENL